MKPKLINLTERQHLWLNEEAARLGIPVSELLRRLIDAQIEFSEAETHAWDEMYAREGVKTADEKNQLGESTTS